jgi:hypothetical protein
VKQWRIGLRQNLVARLLVNLGFCRIRFWYFQGDWPHALLESHMCAIVCCDFQKVDENDQKL